MNYEVCAIRPEALATWENFEEPQTPPPASLQVDKEGTAKIYIQDVLVQKPFFTWQTSSCYETIKAQISTALSNADVKRIKLDIDSPGGSVLGVSDLAEYIYTQRTVKPIYAYVNSMAASAAYWIAAACSKIILASETTLTGSIGVVAVHVDSSKLEADCGVKITEIVAGKYKRIAGNHAPLENEGRAFLQEQVDEYYNIFVSSIAKYRGKKFDEILLVADGKEYIGSKAISVGLADEIEHQIISNNITGEKNMDELEQLKQENERLKQENEQLKKENEELKNGNGNPPSQGENNQQEDPNKKEEMALAINNAIKAERERMSSLDELISDEHSQQVISQAKKEGWSAEKASYEILMGQKKNSGASLRANLAKENKFVASLTNIPSHEEMERTNLVASAVAAVNKKRS